MDISNEQTTTDIKTHQPNEKTTNTNETPNEPKTINSNSFLPKNMDSPNDYSAIKIHSQLITETIPNINETPNPNNDQNILNDNFTNILEPQDPYVTCKRPAPESTCPSSPLSPKPCLSNMETPNISHATKKSTKEKNTKKTKIRSRSSSSTRSITDRLDDQLAIASEIILLNKDLSINSDTLKYIIENFSNKNINIHDLCNKVGSNAVNMLKLIEQIRPILTDRSIKAKITKLSNLLFQSIPPSDM